MAEDSFVGRDDEIAQLTTHYKTAKNGKGQFVLIRGHSGSGKSTLIREFLRRLWEREHEEFFLGWCTCPSLSISALDESLNSILRPEVDVFGTSSDFRKQSIPKLPNKLQLEHGTLGNILLSSPNLAPTSAYQYYDLLVELSRYSPLILVFDNLHQADHDTLRIIRKMAAQDGAVSRHRVLLVGAYIHAQSAPDFNQFLVNVSSVVVPARPDGKAQDLGPVPIRDYLYKRYPGAQFAESFLDELEHRVIGVPLFLKEFCEWWDARQCIVQEPSTGEWRVDFKESDLVAIPANVEKCLQRRLEALDKVEHQYLSFASVLAEEGSAGLQFAAQVLDMMSQTGGALSDITDLCKRLDKLVNGGWLTEQSASDYPGDESLHFYAIRYPLYRDFMIAELGTNSLRRLRETAARGFEAVYTDHMNRRPDIQFRISRLYEKAQNWAKAFQYGYQAVRWKWKALFVQQGERPLDDFGYVRLTLEYEDVLGYAVKCNERCIPCTQAGRLFFEYGKSLERTGNALSALKSYELADDFIADSPGLRAQVLAGKLWSISRSDQRDQRMEELIADADDLLQKGLSTQESADLCQAIGGVYHTCLHYPEARTWFERARGHYQTASDQSGGAAALINLGMSYWGEKEYAVAENLLRQALALAKHEYSIANANANLALILVEKGDFPEAIALYETALAGFRALGNEYDIAMANSNLGEIYLMNGKPEQICEAFNYLEYALEVNQLVRDPGCPRDILRMLEDAQYIPLLSSLSADLEVRLKKLSEKAKHLSGLLEEVGAREPVEKDEAAKRDMAIAALLDQVIKKVDLPDQSQEGELEREVDSLRRQLAEARVNLELIEERKSQYVLEVDVSLQLIKEERQLQDKISQLKRQLGE